VLKDSVLRNIRSWEDFVLLDVYSSSSEMWGKHGIALIGDAAHTMTPTGAFGLNSAMKDADVLAELINKDYIAELDLLNCATIRKEEVAKLQAIQIEKEESFASQFVVLA
jgi:2-polyprenyl-6-methoxyphenol hydroxylase-like FAD-dependent oxidoreductase